MLKTSHEGECSIASGSSEVCSGKPILALIEDTFNIKASSPLSIINEAKLKTKCSTERCVLEKLNKTLSDKKYKDIIDEYIKNYFKQTGPAFTTKLINDRDIDNTLKSFAYFKDNYKYYFIPFQMRDFKCPLVEGRSCKPTELWTVNLNHLLDLGYKTTGTVMNTDVSTGKGIHWFAVFIDMRHIGNIADPFTIEYFNSSGNYPISEVLEWMKYIRDKLSQRGIVSRLIMVTSRALQQSKTECGVYSLSSILSRIKNHDVEEFSRSNIPDEEMIKFRTALFI